MKKEVLYFFLIAAIIGAIIGIIFGNLIGIPCFIVSAAVAVISVFIYTPLEKAIEEHFKRKPNV